MDITLCEYAIELTCRPTEVSQTSIDRLRKVGFADDQITIATQVISYFNYINRIADGLGVDMEGWMTSSEESWKSEKPDWRS